MVMNLESLTCIDHEDCMMYIDLYKGAHSYRQADIFCRSRLEGKMIEYYVDSHSVEKHEYGT